MIPPFDIPSGVSFSAVVFILLQWSHVFKLKRKDFYAWKIFRQLESNYFRVIYFKGSIKSSDRVAWINCLQFVVMLCLTACVGFLLYNKYHTCDPLQAKLITKADQVMLNWTTRRFVYELCFPCSYTHSLSLKLWENFRV